MRIGSTWSFGLRANEEAWPHVAAGRALDAVEAKLVAGVLGQIPAAREDAAEFMALYAGREGGRP